MKWILRILGVLFLLIIALAAYVLLSPTPNYSTVAIPDIQINTDSVQLAAGQQLVMNNCQGCHHGEGTDELSGRMFEDKNANTNFGVIYSSNITNHPEAGIAAYSDGELYRLLRTGVKRNGEMAVVVMPRWPLAAEEDVLAIIAFLRSNHRLVAPSPQTHPPHHPTFLEKALNRFVFAPTAYAETYPEKPKLTELEAYGAYQVNNVNLCYYCHSENIETANALAPQQTPGYLAGGFTFPHIDYDILTPGLLPSSNADLAAWTEEEFIQAVRFGIRPNKPAYKEPMHPFLLDSLEAKAIHAYLLALDQ